MTTQGFIKGRWRVVAECVVSDEPRESPPKTSPVADVKIEPRNDPSAMIQSVVAKHTEFPPPPTPKKQRCRDYDGRSRTAILEEISLPLLISSLKMDSQDKVS